MDRIECIKEVMKQFRWELDKQSWFHKRFAVCSKCESLRKQLVELTIQLKQEINIQSAKTKSKQQREKIKSNT